MSDATPYTPITLDGAAEDSGWFDLRPVVGPILLTAEVTGSVTFYIDISNDERTSGTKSYQSSVAYSSSIAKVFSGAKPRFARVRYSAGSGSLVVGMGKGTNAKGVLTEVNIQSEVD